MKKTVIIILAVLPIVMLISIAFAGRIFSMYNHVAVEKIKFVDELGEELGDNYLFRVNVGESKSTHIHIFPELASNKSVTYTSQDESICTVDKDGNVTGVSIGTSSIVVRSVDGDKTAILGIMVTAERVTGVSLPMTSLELLPGTFEMLTAIVEPYTAIDKNVTYTSDNAEVASVNASGKVTANKAGSAIITVTTHDGGFTAQCTVTVTEGIPPISFDFTGADGVVSSGVGYIVNTTTIDLTPYIIINSTDFSVADVKIQIVGGTDCATLSGNVLTFEGTGIVVLRAYTGNDNAPQNTIELRLMHTS